MTAILGISAYYHDSAAALVVDGQVVAAAQEERFSRRKHDARFPERAIGWCLAEAGLRPDELDHVAFYDKPLAKFERLLETHLAYAPRGFWAFQRAIPGWLREKLRLRARINRPLGRGPRRPVVFLDHHESHAASAFFPSPFDQAAILTLDGVGEWSTATLGAGRGNRIELTHQLAFPHSLGLLYSAFTAWCGFEVNDGEYKLMGLAPYGNPALRDTILRELVDLKPDGSFRLNMDYFTFGYTRRMTGRRFDRLFGGPPRRPAAPIEQRHLDAAASIQAVTEEILLRIAGELHRRTGLADLVLAGGVALNCVANGRLLREGPFSRLWIQPAAGDAGGALGAALFVWHQLLSHDRGGAEAAPTRDASEQHTGEHLVPPADRQQGSLLGPRFTSAEIEALLRSRGVPYRRFDSDAELLEHVAGLLADGHVVGWFRGRMEFGPRALGARSILADPRRPEMQSLLNQKIKLREGFRPFAPAVLAEHAGEWFDLPRGQESPYMLLAAPVREQRRTPLSDDDRRTMAFDPDLCRRARVVRSTIPAVTHVDCSARVQTVDARRNPAFHALLTAFFERTGCPVLVNTSFNRRGEPIVCTPADAFDCFTRSALDFLVLEDCLVPRSPARQTSTTEPSHAMV